ncbi:MAG TPA: metallophosphoesterase [Candidatus Angelobacter sp.]|nr:metallophosphoesterase [Candidatus Angelobacter sp.]
MLTRRHALRALLAAGAGAAITGLYTWLVEPHWLELTSPSLPIAGLPPELEGKTLAQLSDLHVGPAVDDEYIMASLSRVRALAPDFVVCTGDWVTYRSPRQFEQLRRVLAHMPHGRLATLGILGNHDYGFRWGMVDVADQVAEIAGAAGVTMLSNQCVSVAGLQFVGIDDLWGPRFDPMPALAQRDQNMPTVVLCHNPDVADLPVWKQYEGWILAGHTHGGQCKPPFLPPPELPVRNRRYTAGDFYLPGNRHMYISRGVGHLLRVRFNARPEIPIFRLQRDASQTETV